MSKTCTNCGVTKELTDFHKQGSSRGTASQCKTCLNKKQRDRRKVNNNSVTKAYEKTPNGFLMRLYRNMQSRITGVQKEKHYLYTGKELLTREEFYDWAKPNKEFHKLFNEWEASGYDRRLTPSVDRVDSDLGYILSNMEWVTHSENSSRATWARYNKE